MSDRWQKALEEAAVRGAALYDGPLLRLERCIVTAGRLKLDLHPTSFRAFIATNLADPDLPAENRADPLGVSAIVVSADERVILGRRSRKVYGSPGSVHCIAGHVDPTHLRGEGLSSVDVFSAILDEVREELGVSHEHVAATTCIGLVREPLTRQPELIFVVELSLASTEVSVTNDEHDRLVVIEDRIAEIERYVRSEAEAVIPITSTTLGLYCSMK